MCAVPRKGTKKVELKLILHTKFSPLGNVVRVHMYLILALYFCQCFFVKYNLRVSVKLLVLTILNMIIAVTYKSQYILLNYRRFQDL